MAGKLKSQPLPSKEDNLLKQVMKLYDLKQYKKGIKIADQVGMNNV
jgi:N-alpha-acetyltransferase 15/16, NatA auxiliary subunit